MIRNRLAVYRQFPLWRKGLAVTVWPLVIVVALGGSWAGYLRLTGNIHEVEVGKVYRSGQLWPSQLSSLLRVKGIRTVINLRGENPDRAWYVDELQVAKAAGVRHISLPMSANREPNDALLATLIDTLSTAELPVLIHCEAGADRSGLASALYKFTVQHKTPQEADGQLSFWYGHFPWLTSRTGAMDRTFWRVVHQKAWPVPQ
jgi:protein tyrosine/serine phosphatase